MKYFYLSLLIILFIQISLAEEYTNSTINNGGLLLLKVWREYISPVDGPRCMYRPTCSEYARQAIKRYGIVKGTMMASDRLQRCTTCHNYSVYKINEEGYYADPVSENIY